MKTKFQTRASRAEEEVLSILKDEKNIRKPWSLLSYQLQNRTLQTTAAEAAIIFNTHASIRPGYEVGASEVFIPNLFAKLSGTDEAFQVFIDRDSLVKRENTFLYDSFQEFTMNLVDQNLFSEFMTGGQLGKSVLSSGAFGFTFIRREYQELFIDKINEILKNKNEFFISRGMELTDSEVISCILGMDEALIHAFHNFDFQFQPPALIINNKGKEQIGVHHAINLVMLNLLGFDIIVVSPEGYADIENILNPELYCVFIGEKIAQAASERHGKRAILRIITAVAAITVLVITLFASRIFPPWVDEAFRKPADLPTPENASLPQESQVSVMPSAASAPESTAGNSDYIITQIAELPSPEPVAENSDSIVFNDPALEAVIRDLLAKKEGIINAGDIRTLQNLRIIGPFYAAGNKSFVTGYSPDAYYDTDNISHTEKGDIKDVSALSGIDGLYTFEISWQKEFDLRSVINLKVPDLRLNHDNLSDITVLGKLPPLQLLMLDNNNIKDVSPLVNLNISMLTLNNNPITDISSLAEMDGLQCLEIAGCPVSDISPLKALKDLQILVISATKVTDLSVLKELPSLRTLSIVGMKFDAENEAILSELKLPQVIR